MARRLILPLLILIALVGLLAYVGSERGVLFEMLPQRPPAGDFISLQAIIAGTALAILAIILLWSLLIWMWQLPKRVKKGVGRRRGEHGLDAVEQALLAVESGDTSNALKKAKKASELLQRPALTALLSAKAAELGGAHDDAHSHYTALKDKPETQAAGLRGLARLSEGRGDYVASVEMAKAAFENPKAPIWAFDLLYSSQIALSDWAGALETLGTAEKRKLLEKEEIHRRRAVLLVAHADGLEVKGQSTDALDLAKRAADLAPGFSPGVALAARLLLKSGNAKKAAQIIEKAWARTPHPALALAYRDIWHGENQKTIAKKINHLIKTNATHRESSILAAEQALISQDGVKALSALDDLLHGSSAHTTDSAEGEEPSARICSLAAQAEQMLGNAVDAGAWQNRALGAPIEADWSDLDPDGDAFKYTDADWKKLAMSYGKSGTLIHPRYEAHKRRRPVMPIVASVQSNSEPKPPSPDNLGAGAGAGAGAVTGAQSKDSLSDRLENLLDNNS